MLHYLVFLALYILWIPALLGFGSTSCIILLYLLGKKQPSLENHMLITVFGILGMMVVTAVATVINFFMPVSMNITILILISGIMLLGINREKFLSTLYKWDIVLLCILAGIIFLSIPLLWREYYDTGLYHLSAIRWITESTTPLGLANLHNRLGFNNSWFVLAACTDQWALHSEKPFFILNGIATFFYGSAPVLAGKYKFWPIKSDGKAPLHGKNSGNTSNTPGLANIFLFLSLIPWVGRCGFFLSSLYPDLPVMLFTLLIIYLLIRDLEEMNSVNTYSVLACIIAAYAVTIKLSSAPLLLGSLLIIVLRNYLAKIRHKKAGLLQVNNQHSGSCYRSHMPVLLVFLMLTFVPWICRGLALTGCIAYPFPIGHLSGLPWAVPASSIAHLNELILAYARSSDPTPLTIQPGWHWLKPWFIEYKKYLADVLALGLLGTVTVIYSLFRSSNRIYRRVDLIPWIIPLLISLSGIMFWFFAAPNPRFGYGYLYSLGLLLCCFGLMQKPTLAWQRLSKVRTLATCTVAFIIAYGLLVNIYLWATKPGGFNFPTPKLIQRKTTQGVSIYTPAQGDQVWNAPLPNTPYFNESLRVEFSEWTGRPKMFWIPRSTDKLKSERSFYGT